MGDFDSGFTPPPYIPPPPPPPPPPHDASQVMLFVPSHHTNHSTENTPFPFPPDLPAAHRDLSAANFASFDVASGWPQGNDAASLPQPSFDPSSMGPPSFDAPLAPAVSFDAQSMGPPSFEASLSPPGAFEDQDIGPPSFDASLPPSVPIDAQNIGPTPFDAPSDIAPQYDSVGPQLLFDPATMGPPQLDPAPFDPSPVGPDAIQDASPRAPFDPSTMGPPNGDPADDDAIGDGAQDGVSQLSVGFAVAASAIAEILPGQIDAYYDGTSATHVTYNGNDVLTLSGVVDLFLAFHNVEGEKPVIQVELITRGLSPGEKQQLDNFRHSDLGQLIDIRVLEPVAATPASPDSNSQPQQQQTPPAHPNDHPPVHGGSAPETPTPQPPVENNPPVQPGAPNLPGKGSESGTGAAKPADPGAGSSSRPAPAEGPSMGWMLKALWDVFVGPKVEEAVAPVVTIYGPDGMLDKAAQKGIDTLQGLPPHDYVTPEEHAKQLEAIGSVGLTLMPELPKTDGIFGRVKRWISPTEGGAGALGREGQLVPGMAGNAAGPSVGGRLLEEEGAKRGLNSRGAAKIGARPKPNGAAHLPTPGPRGVGRTAGGTLVEHLGQDAVVSDGTWAQYQRRATGTNLEEVFRITRQGESRIFKADGLVNGVLIEAKEGYMGYWRNPFTWEARMLEQAQGYLDVAEALGLKEIRYRVSDADKVAGLRELFARHFPDAVASGRLSVSWQP